jgi:hypothetical protein
MLYELLAGRHPYWSEDQADYARLVQAYKAEPPALLGEMPWPASNAEVSAALHRCLSPDPAARPTAAQLRATLSGRDRKPAAPAAPSRPAPAGLTKPAGVAPPKAAPRAATVAPPTAAARVPIVANAVELVAPGGKALRIAVRTELGKLLMRQFGSDSEFWDDRQCVIERGVDGRWVVTPFVAATNQTLVNGRALSASRVLSQGDLIAVGNEAKGIVKLPLAVRTA